MRHIIILALIIALLAWAISYLLPWWSMGIAAFAAGLLFNVKGLVAFTAGFIGVFALWLGAAFYIDGANNGILSAKVAPLLQVPSPEILILITAIAGGLCAGMACLTANLFRKSFAV